MSQINLGAETDGICQEHVSDWVGDEADDRPFVSNVSFVVKESKFVPVCWDVGPVVCGYCKRQCQSIQAMYKHMVANHKEEIERFKMRLTYFSRQKYQLGSWDGKEVRIEDYVDGNRGHDNDTFAVEEETSGEKDRTDSNLKRKRPLSTRCLPMRKKKKHATTNK